MQLRGKDVLYGFVGVTTDGETLYSPVGATTFKRPKDCQLSHLYLVAMGAPATHGTDGSFPYSFRVSPKK